MHKGEPIYYHSSLFKPLLEEDLLYKKYTYSGGILDDIIMRVPNVCVDSVIFNGILAIRCQDRTNLYILERDCYYGYNGAY